MSFEENRTKGLPVEFRNGATEAVIEYDRPLVHFWFFGLDHPGDESRLRDWCRLGSRGLVALARIKVATLCLTTSMRLSLTIFWTSSRVEVPGRYPCLAVDADRAGPPFPPPPR